MKGNNGLKFFLVIAVIAILTFISFSGNFFGIKVPGSVYDIRPGIDINGGISAKLYAETTDNSKPTQEQLDSAKNVIEKRLDRLNILDRQVTTDLDDGAILLEMPWKAGETEYDPDKAIQEIGKTALLTFQEVDASKIDSNGYYIHDEENKPTGIVLLEGKYVVSANPQKNMQSGGMEVALKFDAEGTKLFADATQKLLKKPIAIYMDDQFISAPRVDAHITDGEAVITLGGRSNDDAAIAEAKDLAETIRSGSLPFRLDAKQVNGISPLLGKAALEVTVKAAIVAFILVCLFMIVFYRLPGVLACIALLGHTVLQLLFISWLNLTTITLPGLAGIILTIGMGVDANIIIFERIKEELRSGKTLRAAIDVGFKRAFTAILDANVTTLIAAVVLFIFGTGPILSFAYTLFIGVILSFLTAVTVSRIMIKSVADLDIAKNQWLYGVKVVSK